MQRRNVSFAALAAVIVASLIGAAIVTNSHSKVGRHVTLAGTSIAGLDRAELRTKVDALDANLRAATVKVNTPKHAFSLTLDELGASIDVDQTVANALNVGHSGNPLGRVDLDG